MIEKMVLFADIPMALFHIYSWGLPIVILGALYGMRWKVGMWGNALSLGAVLFSALAAFGYWEFLAEFLANQVPAMLFIADCLALWIIFIVTLLILDTATRAMSTVKVKYNDIVENIGNGLVLFLLAMALYTFACIANGPLGMAGEHEGNSPELKGEGFATDACLDAMRMLSAGNLSGFTGITRFDCTGELLDLHLKRRQALMHTMRKARAAEEAFLGSVKYDGDIPERKQLCAGCQYCE